MPPLDLKQSPVQLLLMGPLLFLALLAVGRWLKRRGGVQLGISYKLFCLAVGVFVPLNFTDAPSWVSRLLAALVMVLGTTVGLALVRRFLWECYFRDRHHIAVPRYVQDVVAMLSQAIAIIAVLTFIYDLRIPGLLAGSGIVAVILGLALQDTLGNIFAGFALHFGKPFKPGDWLVLDQRHAEVMEINWRSTRLRTNDNTYFDVPNNQINKQVIFNLSYPDRIHAMRLSVGIDYLVPPSEAKDALLHATRQATGVLSQPPPKVFLAGFGESAVNYDIKFWLEDHATFNDVTDAIRSNVWYELQRRRIKIPAPIRTVQLQRSSAVGERPGEPVADMLRRQPVFQSLDETERARLLDAARLLRFGRGERLLEQDEPGDSMFVLVRGDVTVSIRAHGQTVRVATLHPGECFGEMSVLTGAPRSATVTAQTDCQVLEIEKAVLAEFLQSRPELTKTLSELLARRQLEMEGQAAGNKQSPAAPTRADRHRQYAEGLLARITQFFDL